MLVLDTTSFGVHRVAFHCIKDLNHTEETTINAVYFKSVLTSSNKGVFILDTVIILLET